MSFSKLESIGEKMTTYRLTVSRFIVIYHIVSFFVIRTVRTYHITDVLPLTSYNFHLIRRSTNIFLQNQNSLFELRKLIFNK